MCEGERGQEREREREFLSSELRETEEEAPGMLQPWKLEEKKKNPDPSV